MEKVRPHTIRCPICNKGKFVDIEHSSGKNSVVCNVCKQFIVLDWDHMTAKPGDKLIQVANY